MPSPSSPDLPDGSTHSKSKANTSNELSDTAITRKAEMDRVKKKIAALQEQLGQLIQYEKISQDIMDLEEEKKKRRSTLFLD